MSQESSVLQISRVRQLPPPNISPPRSPALRRASPPRREASRSSGVRLGPAVIGILLCLLGLLVYMWPRVQIMRLGYGLQTAEQRLKDLSRERDQLHLEIALLKNPQRVYGVATEQLGMAVPKPDQVFVLTREGKAQ